MWNIRMHKISKEKIPFERIGFILRNTETGVEGG
jgi:hypothetical protein